MRSVKYADDEGYTIEVFPFCKERKTIRFYITEANNEDLESKYYDMNVSDLENLIGDLQDFLKEIK